MKWISFREKKFSVDLNEVSHLNLDESKKMVVMTMKSGKEVIFAPDDNHTDQEIFTLINDLLQSFFESKNRLENIKLDIYKEIVSELKGIHSKLKKEA